MNLEKGIVCSLTGEHATFDSECSHFEADKNAVTRQINKQMVIKESGGILEGSNWFLWIGGLSILNIFLAFAGLSFIFGLATTVFMQSLFTSLGNPTAGVLIAIFISCFYIWTYHLTAKQEQLWAYFAGWTIYSIDALLYFFILFLYGFDFSIIWALGFHIILLLILYVKNPFFNSQTWSAIKTFEWTNTRIAYAIYGVISILIEVSCLFFICLFYLS